MAENPLESDDPDWAPQLPSIWDVEDSDEDEEALLEADPFAPPIPMAARQPDCMEPAVWIDAEGRAGRALATATEAVTRLDERLRRVPDDVRLAWRDRLALTDISNLLWAEGVRLRVETLALTDVGRLGRTQDEDQVVARGQWAWRRLTGRGALPVSAADLDLFLGRRPSLQPVPGGDDAAWSDLPETIVPTGSDPAATARWIDAARALDEAHPLTRSAAAFHLWRGFGLSGRDAWLEPGVVAARIGATELKAGLSALPLLAGSELALVRGVGGADVRLETWLTGLARAADHAQMKLDRIEAWQAAAQARAAGMKGKGATALLRLIAARPVVSVRNVSTATGLSEVQARTLLNRLEDLGVIRELTGHTRFRYWAIEADL